MERQRARRGGSQMRTEDELIREVRILAGEHSTRTSHATFDVAGAGNVTNGGRTEGHSESCRAPTGA